MLALILGYTGSILLIISFLAQIYSIHKSKKADNISHVFLLLQLLVNIMFLIYDISIVSYPFILSNGSVSFLLICMWGQKYYYTNIYQYETINILP